MLPFIRYFERGAPDGPPKKRKNRESGGNTPKMVFSQLQDSGHVSGCRPRPKWSSFQRAIQPVLVHRSFAGKYCGNALSLRNPLSRMNSRQERKVTNGL
jgi:hypothetical protein